MSFIFPVYVPQEDKEKAKEVQEAVDNSVLKECECGCGRYAKKGNRYLKAHHWFKNLAAQIRRKDAIARNRIFPYFELEAARLDYGYSREILAKKMKVSRRMIEYWEKNKRLPSQEREKQMIEILPMLRNKYK